jgi:hypothetical protein
MARTAQEEYDDAKEELYSFSTRDEFLEAEVKLDKAVRRLIAEGVQEVLEVVHLEDCYPDEIALRVLPEESDGD